MAKMGIEIVHRIVVVIAIVLGIALTGFCETVENVRGQQRENSKLVDIYYDLNATDGWSYTIEVAIEGRTTEVTAATISGDIGKDIVVGENRHIVWDAGADWPDSKGDVKAIVTATKGVSKGKVQLWEGGPYWADRNIGADNPWDYGLYFWWGDTVGHRPSGTTFSFSFEVSNCPTYHIWIGDLKNEGWLTSNGVLAPKHDAAHVQWGGDWRMPTEHELADLSNLCDWTWTTINGVNGYVVCGRGNYASNSIFLPCAGYGSGNSFKAGSYGYYWSSAYGINSNIAANLDFNDNGLNRSRLGARYLGFSIRPVQ